jgi:hypothetical protein
LRQAFAGDGVHQQHFALHDRQARSLCIRRMHRHGIQHRVARIVGRHQQQHAAAGQIDVRARRGLRLCVGRAVGHRLERVDQFALGQRGGGGVGVQSQHGGL